MLALNTNASLEYWLHYIIQHFAIDFVHPICIDQETTQQHGMIRKAYGAFFSGGD